MSVAYIPPQVPTSTQTPPSGDGWIHEIKHDGFRTLICINGSWIKTYTRSGYDWTTRYAPIIKACRALQCDSAAIDGEMVVEDKDGISNFDALHYSTSRPE